MNAHQVILSGSLSLLLACGGSPAADCPADAQGHPVCLGELAQPSRSYQGRSYQGRSYQGRSYQGRSYQGTDIAVSTVTEIRIGGVSVENLELGGTLLKGSLNGQPLAGPDFIGATVLQQDIDGTIFEATLTNVESDSQDPSGEIFLYTLMVQNPDTGTVENLCNPDPWGGQYATVVYGSWNFSGAHVDSAPQFMFGCTAGVVAKCVRWGYKPWKNVNGVSLADYHQACTRMARADYCGDGVTHTQDGTLIDMYDDLAIQVRSSFDPSSPLYFEAAWSPQGAYCISKDRWVQLSGLTSVPLDCQAKFLDNSSVFRQSPVDPQDRCVFIRSDIEKSQVHIDDSSGLNINLF